jgi:uncharacterized membrane protein YeaQ/YmgE (transglycosylase-associated protein family)
MRVHVRRRRSSRKDDALIGEIIVWIIVGLIAGVLAKFILPGDDPGGLIVTILIGIVGAFLGGFLLDLIGIGGATGGFSLGSILTATVGAIILLLIYRMFAGRTT